MSSDKMSKQLRQYEAEKLKTAEKREELMLNQETWFDKFLDGISRLKKKMNHPRRQQSPIHQKSEKTH